MSELPTVILMNDDGTLWSLDKEYSEALPVEFIRIDIAREMFSQFPAPVRVKALQWRDEYRPVALPEPYQIWPDNGGSGAPDDPLETYDGFMLYSPLMMALGLHPTLEAAKSAAQADYETSILAALQPAAGVVAELVEALELTTARLAEIFQDADTSKADPGYPAAINRILERNRAALAKLGVR